MKGFLSILIFSFLLLFFIQCKKDTKPFIPTSKNNSIKYAKGISIENYAEFSVVTVKNSWPNANKSFQYILKKENAIIPDSLKQYPLITVPVKTIAVTSTTHIPSLEALGEEEKLIGFPHLDYISSEKVRNRIALGKIKELGTYQSLNTEVLLSLQPDVIVGHGIDNNNPALDNLQKSGLKVMINGDWNEETALGKAEWIKFFGVLFGKQKQADSIFSKMEQDFVKTLAIAKKASDKPTILMGDIYEGKWYLPKGTSWVSLLLKEANGNYLWQDTKGTGSLSMSFETVFEKAKNAKIWITSGQFSSLKEMNESNPHYKEFDAFKNKNVFSLRTSKEKGGGILFYELGPNRPDLVLKDMVKIVHPQLLPDYELFFFEKLK